MDDSGSGLSTNSSSQEAWALDLEGYFKIEVEGGPHVHEGHLCLHRLLLQSSESGCELQKTKLIHPGSPQ